MRIEAPRYETALPSTVLVRGAVFIDIVKKPMHWIRMSDENYHSCVDICYLYMNYFQEGLYDIL